VFYWFKERLRDLWLWLLNLVRDFPTRSGRLARTLFTGGKAVLMTPLLVARTRKSRPVGQQAQHIARQIGIWLHLLLVHSFDLVGGPEICQFIMHLGMYTTPLTAAEQTAVQTIFGVNNLRYQDVRIAEGGILNFIFRYNGQLAFTIWYTVHLPRLKIEEETAVPSRQNLPLLIHELAHVYHHHHIGSRCLGEAIYYLSTTHRDCYQYGGSSGLQACWQQGKSFRQFNREQQAQIIQDYYSKSQDSQDISTYLPYLAQFRNQEL
jgi:hypothetical protein